MEPPTSCDQATGKHDVISSTRKRRRLTHKSPVLEKPFLGSPLVSFLLDLGDMSRHGCPGSPEWIISCSASETSLCCDMYEHNNECRAIEVIGQDRSSEVVALFLEDWELGRVALSHMAMDLLSQEMRDACWDSSESLGSPCSPCSQSQEGSSTEE